MSLLIACLQFCLNISIILKIFFMEELKCYILCRIEYQCFTEVFIYLAKKDWTYAYFKHTSMYTLSIYIYIMYAYISKIHTNSPLCMILHSMTLFIQGKLWSKILNRKFQKQLIWCIKCTWYICNTAEPCARLILLGWNGKYLSCQQIHYVWTAFPVVTLW